MTLHENRQDSQKTVHGINERSSKRTLANRLPVIMDSSSRRKTKVNVWWSRQVMCYYLAATRRQGGIVTSSLNLP